MNIIGFSITYIIALSLNGFIMFRFVLLRFFNSHNYSGKLDTRTIANIGAADKNINILFFLLFILYKIVSF